MDDPAEQKLFDFVDSLDENIVEKNVWESISDAIDNWTQSILDAEAKHDKTEDIRLKLENIFQRQQIDGFLSEQDISELRYISNLWIKLAHAVTSYRIGCGSLKKEVLYLMLELVLLNQFDRDVFITCCMQL